MENEIIEENYTTKDMAKDIAVETGKIVAAQVAAVAILAAAGFAITKVQDLKEKRKAKKESKKIED